MKNSLYDGFAILMAITYQVLLVILIFLRPDIHPYSNTISEWAIGKSGWLMQIAFFCSALSYLFLFLSLRKEVHGRWGKAGLVLLFICFVGTAGAGAFVTDPYPPDFTITTTIVHTISGGLGMLLLPFAALFINRNLMKAIQWKNAKNRYAGQHFYPCWHLQALLFILTFLLFCWEEMQLATMFQLVILPG